ncbi:MAG TPA: class I adenylate-forming enzyme family protein [Xanthobacteraceae bacterium]|nr:class I adenylate-forming enzyme family protein [Xanthobacteraceae bacterium]
MSNAAPVVSFADLIFHHALSCPAKPAVILADRVVTYAMMAQGILRAEERIRTLALHPGALVCVALDSPIRTLVVAAALFRLGHPVIVTTRGEDCLNLRLPVGTFLQDPGGALLPGQRQAVVDDAWFAGESRPVSAAARKGFADERQICCVALSSGTTGRPKAISLTVEAFHQWVRNQYLAIGLGTWERLLLVVGLTGSWGLSLAAHALFAGRTLVFAANARETLHMIAVYAVDAMAATSLQLRDIVREQLREPLPSTSLSTVLTGGAMLSRAAIAEARANLCSSIIIGYGSSEAGLSAYASADQLGSTEGAAGFITPWTKVEIVSETGDPLPAGRDGIVRVRSTCMGAPYPPGTDNPNFRGNWFYPEDLGRITPEGLLVIAGRTSDVINVGGHKLAPELIEDVLRQHPAVSEAAALGSVGEDGFEQISIALIAKTPVPDASLIAWCAERGIPLTRIFHVETLPRSAAGKIQRDLLKRQLLGSTGSM